MDKTALWRSLRQSEKFFWEELKERERTASASATQGFVGFHFPLVRQQDLGLARTIRMTESERLRKLCVRWEDHLLWWPQYHPQCDCSRSAQSCTNYASHCEWMWEEWSCRSCPVKRTDIFICTYYLTYSLKQSPSNYTWGLQGTNPWQQKFWVRTVVEGSGSALHQTKGGFIDLVCMTQTQIQANGLLRTNGYLQFFPSDSTMSKMQRH